jgi:hypothetical protein
VDRKAVLSDGIRPHKALPREPFERAGVESFVWRDVMIALGLWKAPTTPVVVVPAPVAISCSFGAPPIRRVFKEHRAQLTRCYTRVVEYRGGADGTAVLHVTIAADGTVTATSVDGTLDDARITGCLVAEVKRWSFPADDATVVVNYPLQFRLAR